MSSVLRGCRVLLAQAKSGSKVSAMAAKPTAKAAKEAKPKRVVSPNAGILKPVPVSQQLASFLGVSQSSRGNVVKQVWAHIKQHDLQNPNNKREVYCDRKLRGLFNGRESVNFLEIGKLLNPHFIKTSA